MIEAVLFDNDGVLVDTEGLYFQAGQATLAEVGFDLTLEIYREVSLRQGRSVIDLAADRGYDAEAIQVLRERRDQRYARSLERGVALLAEEQWTRRF